MLSLLSRSQTFSQPNTNWGLIWLRGSFDSTLYMPTGCGAANSTSYLFSQGKTGAGQKLRKAAFYYDSCGHHLYSFDPALQAWHVVDTANGISPVGVIDFNGRCCSITPMEIDYQSFYVDLASVYNNPIWLNSLAAAKISGASNISPGSSKIAITGGVASVLQSVVIDANQANFSLSAIGGALNIFQINASGSYTSRKTLWGDARWDYVDFDSLINIPNTLAGYGITDAVRNIANVNGIQEGIYSGRPNAAAGIHTIYIALDSAKIYYSDGSSWTNIGGGVGGSGFLGLLNLYIQNGLYAYNDSTLRWGSHGSTNPLLENTNINGQNNYSLSFDSLKFYLTGITKALGDTTTFDIAGVNKSTGEIEEISWPVNGPYPLGNGLGQRFAVWNPNATSLYYTPMGWDTVNNYLTLAATGFHDAGINWGTSTQPLTKTTINKAWIFGDNDSLSRTPGFPITLIMGSNQKLGYGGAAIGYENRDRSATNQNSPTFFFGTSLYRPQGVENGRTFFALGSGIDTTQILTTDVIVLGVSGSANYPEQTRVHNVMIADSNGIARFPNIPSSSFDTTTYKNIVADANGKLWKSSWFTGPKGNGSPYQLANWSADGNTLYYNPIHWDSAHNTFDDGGVTKHGINWGTGNSTVYTSARAIIFGNFDTITTAGLSMSFIIGQANRLKTAGSVGIGIGNKDYSQSGSITYLIGNGMERPNVQNIANLPFGAFGTGEDTTQINNTDVFVLGAQTVTKVFNILIADTNLVARFPNAVKFSAATTSITSINIPPGTRPTSPHEGDIYVDSGDHHTYEWNGSAWKQLDN
jgi:hypothetical protein